MYCLLTLVLFVLCVEAGRHGAYREKGWKHQYRYGNVHRYGYKRPDDEGSNCSSVVNCSNPETPSNGQISLVDTKVGYSATFTCDPGFRMCGADKITCGYDGEWDRGVPVCIEPFSKDTDLTVAFGDSIYYFSSEKETFGDAQVFCENLGGNLLSINSKTEWDFITCLSWADNSGDISRWIGLINNNGTWEWTDGQTVTETHWHPDQLYNPPYCAARMPYDFLGFLWLGFRKVDCDVFRNEFICELNDA